GDDGNGVVGLAPSSKILPVRVLDAQNRYDDAIVVARGVQWAVDHGAQVINLSLGGAAYNPALADALDYAFSRDVVVVACTGNRLAGEPTEVWYPAREPGVLAVSGVDLESADASDPLWPGSLTGPATVLTAPATDLLGAAPRGGYWRVQGTSFAAPLVSATAALVRARWPRMSAANVVQRLTQTARDLGAPGRDSRFGFGLVDPVRALQAPVAEVAANPLDTAPPPGVAEFGPSDPAEPPRHLGSHAAV
ncbi:MAG TPA: S8 family serine peptidase, partial [Micromonosporaceae bacterium]|nr:S8 family serine peptidase [Micromonosporaceae bacterium]